ncbi:acetyltransferase [Arthrobacter glacialis]|nr:acetyltransferase [Arthrobacter glacialis]
MKGIEPSHISPRCFFGGKNINIGRDTFINYGCFFDAADTISIGQRVRVGMNVTMVTGSHQIGPPEQRAGAEEAYPIHIGNGVWIGANVTILPGVKIGDGAVVGAGSVVTKSIPANELHAGVPARRMRPLLADLELLG